MAQCGHEVAYPQESLVMVRDALWIIVLSCASLAVVALVVQLGQMFS